VYALFLLLPVHNTRAQALQTDELAIAAAKELAETYSKANVPFLPGRLRELYVDVATPIFARRLAAEDIRFLTDEFKAPVFQALTTALAESLAMIMPCLQSNLDALPKLQEPPAEERSRLARQLWALQQEANPSRYQTGSDAANPPIPEELQEQFARFQEEWRQRSNCIDDSTTAILATRLTGEDLKNMIALEQSAPMQKLNAVAEEVQEQLRLKLSAEFWESRGRR
jgi:hypothetical protein